MILQDCCWGLMNCEYTHTIHTDNDRVRLCANHKDFVYITYKHTYVLLLSYSSVQYINKDLTEEFYTLSGFPDNLYKKVHRLAVLYVSQGVESLLVTYY